MGGVTLVEKSGSGGILILYEFVARMSRHDGSGPGIGALAQLSRPIVSCRPYPVQGTSEPGRHAKRTPEKYRTEIFKAVMTTCRVAVA